MTRAEELAKKMRAALPTKTVYELRADGTRTPDLEVVHSREADAALSELVAMADCDCIPFVAWSLSCPKCGRIAAMTQERFQKFIAQAADAEALAELRAQIRHLADEVEEWEPRFLKRGEIAERLRALVKP